MSAPLDCRSPEGITVGLVDGIIAAARIIRTRDHLAHPAVVEALRDIADDDDVAWLVGHAITPRSGSAMKPSPAELAKIAYTAYGDWANWTNYAGSPMPSWAELPEPQRTAWAVAVGAAVRAVLTPPSQKGAASADEAAP